MTARRALLIACSTYDDPAVRRLRTPTYDIDGVGHVLAEPAIGGFELTRLVDEPEVTVRRTLGRFLRQARRTDLLLVYFACHGFKEDDGQLYLGARDTDLSDVVSTALPADLVRRLVDLSPSRRTVLVLDCCYSGAITRSLNSRDVDVVQIGDIFRSQGEGRVIISASRATEYAYERGGDPVPLRENPMYSVFAEAFIHGLGTGAADLDDDGVVSVTELYEFVHQRVVASTCGQTPGLWNQVNGKLFIAHRAPAGRAVIPIERTAVSRPPDQRTPFDADVLSWRFGATPGVQQAFASAGPSVSRAWRAAVNGEWLTARGFFGRALRDNANGGAALWWGKALCEAVDQAWQPAGTDFAHAAALAQHDPGIFAGAALLSTAALRAAKSPRWYEPLEDLLERVPSCPQALAYRGVQLDDPDALSLAIQLAPELIEDFEAVGVPLGDVAAAALTEAERRSALLVRAQTTVHAVRGRLASVALSYGAHGAATGAHSAATGAHSAATLSSPAVHRTRVVDRLHAAGRAIEEHRRGLIEASGILNGAAQELLDRSTDASAMVLVTAVREASATVIAALRETDRPAAVWAIGIPPRIQLPA